MKGMLTVDQGDQLQGAVLGMALAKTMAGRPMVAGKTVMIVVNKGSDATVDSIEDRVGESIKLKSLLIWLEISSVTSLLV